MTGSSARPSPFQWRRGPRSSFVLGKEIGVYALFLRNGSSLPGVQPGEQGLLYIGCTESSKGLQKRCHFCGNTSGHSPRRSLAALLLHELDLEPVFVSKPNAPDTWGLDQRSEAKLDDWMHANLLLAIEICDDPLRREGELIRSLGPPLNLNKCLQTPQHLMVSRTRAEVFGRAKDAFAGKSTAASAQHGTRPNSSHGIKHEKRNRTEAFVSSGHSFAPTMDTAGAIAARYDLNPKSYRQQLRERVSWYRKPQVWSFVEGSQEWRDMIAVAEEMTKRRP